MKKKLYTIIGLTFMSAAFNAYCAPTAIPGSPAANPEENIVVGTIPPSEPCRSYSFESDQYDSYNHLLLNSHSLPVSDERITLWGLNLNNVGNSIQVAPGEEIQAMSTYIYNCPFCESGSINQIIIGIKGIGAQTCIYSGSTEGQGIAHFSLIAPQNPGTYSIEFRYAQAYSCADAIKSWWNIDHPPADSSIIGTIIVKKPEF